MRRHSLALLALPFLVLEAWTVAVLSSHAAFVAIPLDPGFAEDGHARLVADLERVRALGFFEGRGTRHDAAPVLNPMFGAYPASEATTRAWWAKEGAFAALDAVEYEWWAHPEITETYDLSFLRDWRVYDHWGWSDADPFTPHRAAHPDECYFDAPFLDLSSVQRLAKIRLAQGLHRDELADASADVHALALLVSSTDELVGILLGMALYEHEARAFEEAGKLGRSVPDTHPWTAADRTMARSAMAGLAGLFLYDPDSAIAQLLVERAGELPGVCAGLGEGARFYSLVRRSIERPWPGEPDQSRYARGLDASLSRAGCRISSAREDWARSLPHCLTADDSFPPAVGFAARVPYLRAPIVRIFIQIGRPGFVGPYG